MRTLWQLYYNSTYYDINPDVTDIKYTLDNVDGRSVLKINGNLVLVGDDYDSYYSMIAYSNYYIYNYYGGTQLFYSDKARITVVSEDEDIKRIELELTALTTYSSDYFKNYNTEYNINSLTPESLDLHFAQGYFPVYNRDPYFIGYFGVYAVPSDMSNVEIANWDIDFAANIGTCSGGVYTNLQVGYKRQIGYGYYIGTTKYNPEGNVYSGTNWKYLDDVNTGTKIVPRYKRNVTNNYIGTGSGPTCYADIQNNVTYYDEYEIEYTGVTRKVTDVIEFLISEMGFTAINFDTSGTITDSFYSFKTMTGTSLKYGSTKSDLLYSKLLLMNLTDFIPTSSNTQKSSPANITKVSLQTIHEFFEKRGFYWYIEDRSGTLYYMLRHKSDKSLGSSNPDLSDYKNRNWMQYAKFYEKEPPAYHKVVNKTIQQSIDFEGTELKCDNVYGVDTEKTFNDANVYTDLNDIAERREDVYSEDEQNNIIIIAAQEDTGIKDYVREDTGKISLIPINNSELSWSFIAEEYYTELPDADIIVNGGSVTASDYRLRKRKKYKIEIPGLYTDFAIEDYLEWYGEEAEIDNISQEDELLSIDFRL